MVGQLGTAELAAVSLGNSFVFIAMSLGIGFSTGYYTLGRRSGWCWRSSRWKAGVEAWFGVVHLVGAFVVWHHPVVQAHVKLHATTS